ncbi:hypothetical protein [Acidithiobacillus ferridurans]|uniref:Uncharacterized protein n=1 Tax=Acidithiobacillus ferridurans TaxID=1232575 RepID=A0A8X8G9Z5_ACIFI|nr:hypothetical protein [Acidithiobacillus ferridurans]MBU2715573.1 hypothetical protein [Acidithiobacillus ferridurans]MBU2722937.1 hypothetical protein [Acidithiobacillus ferridurans]MBU2728171.1 hypothetical protein [Acidithiobacillus ferridurans]
MLLVIVIVALLAVVAIGHQAMSTQQQPRTPLKAPQRNAVAQPSKSSSTQVLEPVPFDDLLPDYPEAVEKKNANRNEELPQPAPVDDHYFNCIDWSVPFDNYAAERPDMDVEDFFMDKENA